MKLQTYANAKLQDYTFVAMTTLSFVIVLYSHFYFKTILSYMLDDSTRLYPCSCTRLHTCIWYITTYYVIWLKDLHISVTTLAIHMISHGFIVMVTFVGHFNMVAHYALLIWQFRDRFPVLDNLPRSDKTLFSLERI